VHLLNPRPTQPPTAKSIDFFSCAFCGVFELGEIQNTTKFNPVEKSDCGRSSKTPYEICFAKQIEENL
jgi:hypothetical protein